MSPSWRDRVSVFVGAGEVRAQVWRRGIAPQPGPLLRGATLREALHGVHLAHAHVDVTLSNAWVRYALVPDADVLRNGAERQAAASHALAYTYGDMARGWVVAADRAGLFPGMLAAGIPSHLRDELNTVLVEAGATRVSIQPALARAVNLSRADPGSTSYWLAVAEPTRIVLAAFSAGALLAVRSQRIRGGLVDDLTILLQQSRLLDGMPAEAEEVIAFTEEPAEPGALEGFRVRWVTQDFTLPQPARSRGDRLVIDFGRSPATLRAADLAWLTVGVAALAVSAWQYGTVATERAAVRSALADADRFLNRQASPPLDPNRPDARAIASEVARANAVATRLQVPWESLFTDIETAAGEGVTLLGFEPEGGMRRLRITGEARRFEDLTQYLRRLEAVPALHNVFLTSHELRDRGLTFTLTADWLRSDEQARP